MAMPEERPTETWQTPILAALSSATSLIEDHFVGIGNHLDAALELLERQTTTFETLAGELEGPLAGAAMDGLADAITQISDSTHDHARTSDTLAALTQAMARLQDHVPPLASHVRELTILAMYTRLEGSRLGPEGYEFVAFTDRMGQSVQLARDNLAEFEREIESVGALVLAAMQEREAFAQTHLTALDRVAARLAENLEALRGHREQVAKSGVQVADQSRQMQQRVGQVVLALQVGDSTRQRLEHVHALVAMMGSLTGAKDSTDLSQDARDDLLGTGSVLAAELVSDAVTEFDHEIRNVVSVFQGLAADAKALIQLGDVISGRTADRGGKTYLTAIQADMSDVQDALLAMKAARSASQQMIGTIKSSANLLATRIGLVQELEGEMMHMELNASLKCQRLGSLGASVRIITGELRGCGQRAAQEAAGATAILQSLNSTIKDLSADKSTDVLEHSDRLVAQALQTLGDIEQQSNTALTQLQQHGAEVIRLLERSAEGIVVNEDVIRLTDDAVSSLPLGSRAGNIPKPATADMLTAIARIYTMASERTIHAGIAGQQECPVAELATADDFML